MFVLRSGKLVAVPVQIVLTAATQAAVTPLSGTLQVDDAVVTGDSSGASPQPHPAVSTQKAPAFGSGAQGGGAARAVH